MTRPVIDLDNLVEPLDPTQAWRRGDHSVRLAIQVRPADLSVSYALMEGSGIRQPAFFRWLFQKGNEAAVIEQFARLKLRSETFDAYS